MPISMPITPETSTELLITHAISEVQRVHSGEEFCVGDLFPAYEWFRLSNHVRANIGYGFYHQYANSESISQVTVLSKTKKGQQIYRKN